MVVLFILLLLIFKPFIPVHLHFSQVLISDGLNEAREVRCVWSFALGADVPRCYRTKGIGVSSAFMPYAQVDNLPTEAASLPALAY